MSRICESANDIPIKLHNKAIKLQDKPAKTTPNPPLYKWVCCSCKNDAGTARYIVNFKGQEMRLCQDCHKTFIDVFGTSSVNDPKATWTGFKDKKADRANMQCHFCKKDIVSGFAVAAGTECDDCHGKIKHVSKRGLGIKRKSAIGEAPADIIAASKKRPKDTNPFKVAPKAASFHQQFFEMEDDYYDHIDNLYGWDGGNGGYRQNKHLLQEIDDYHGD